MTIGLPNGAPATCGIAATGTEFLGERILAWCPQTGSGLSSAWGPWEGAAIAGAGQIIDLVPAPGSLPTALITMRDLDPLSGEPLLDDPVTGAGNDDLWTPTTDTQQP